MTRVLIVTGQHFATQPRKVDLHFMAEALNARGIRVDFLSMRLSLVSRLMSDERWAFAKTRALNQWTEITPLLGEFIWVSAVHPISLGKPLLDLVSTPLAKVYGRHIPRAVKAELPEYTHILVESGISILTIPALRRLAPKARIIYHAADRLSTIGAHPAAHAVLRESIGAVDLVHVMADAIRGDIPAGVPTVHLPHGISRTVFDQMTESPYDASKNAVSVGDMLFDAETIRTLATGYPDWIFHLFGRLARLDESPPNIVAHGERPFDEVAAYIKFADIGIAPYRPPIVAPSFAAAGRGHVLAYEPGDADSIRAAFRTAMEFDRETIDTSSVLSWEEKTARLFDLDSVTSSSRPATRLSA